jgi:hypothetical protein
VVEQAVKKPRDRSFGAARRTLQNQDRVGTGGTQAGENPGKHGGPVFRGAEIENGADPVNGVGQTAGFAGDRKRPGVARIREEEATARIGAPTGALIAMKSPDSL